MFPQKKPSSARAAKMTGSDCPKPKTLAVVAIQETHILNYQVWHRRTRACSLARATYCTCRLSAQRNARFSIFY